MNRLFVMRSLFILWVTMAFVLNIHDFLSITQRVPAEVLVVEGWGYDSPAFAEAADEFKRGGYRLLLTVGGPAVVGDKNSEQVSYAVLAANRLQALGVEPQSMIALSVPDVARHHTYSSALTVRDWLKRSETSTKGINVFTLGPHARKSLVLFSRALGAAYPVGVIAGTDHDYDPKRWWLSTRGIYVIARKTVGYIYAVIWPLPEEIPMTTSSA
jgi:DUF218 domain